MERSGFAIDHRARDFVSLLAATGFMAVLPLALGDFWLYLIRITGIYAILTMGLNVFQGYCGQINMGVSGFFCIGAYMSYIFQTTLGFHYALAFPAVTAVSLFISWIVSWPLLRLRTHAMAIGTLAFSMAVYLIFERLGKITGGSDGTVVPSTVFFGKQMGPLFYYYLVLAFFVTIFAMIYFLVHSRVGRALKAVRDNEDAARAMAIDSDHYRRLSWHVSSVLASVAGTLYSQQAGFISPDTFSLFANIQILLMLCLGGPATMVGPVVGAAIISCLPYLLVSIQQYTYLVQGLILFGVLRFLPEGVVGTIIRRFTGLGVRTNE
jgi:branched-chain amino acid transport system permease protein